MLREWILCFQLISSRCDSFLIATDWRQSRVSCSSASLSLWKLHAGFALHWSCSKIELYVRSIRMMKIRDVPDGAPREIFGLVTKRKVFSDPSNDIL